MDFLNSIDQAMNKAKEVFDVACKKTGEVVNTQKQKFDVSSLENKRAKDFEKLGSLYFDLIKIEKIENESIAELVAAIKEKNEKIEELQNEILNAKNKRICANCGAYIEESSIYCNSCGAKVTIEDEE